MVYRGISASGVHAQLGRALCVRALNGCTAGAGSGIVHAAAPHSVLCTPVREVSAGALFATTTLSSSSRRAAGGEAARDRRPASVSSAAPQASQASNLTGDGVLSTGTRRAMRDDTIIVEEVFRRIPQDGALLTTSLYASLPSEVQEALSEKHGGLLAFLRSRPQIFVLRERPEDSKMYVAGNPIAARRFHVRALQKATVRQLMGLSESGTGGGAGRPRGQKPQGYRSRGPRSGDARPRSTGGDHRDVRQGAAPAARGGFGAPPRSPGGASAPRRQQFGV